MIFTYEIQGTDADSNVWKTQGVIVSDALFPEVLNLVQKDSFNKLTSGKAQYGNPGAGCNGPYRIIRIAVTRVDQ